MTVTDADIDAELEDLAGSPGKTPRSCAASGKRRACCRCSRSRSCTARPRDGCSSNVEVVEKEPEAREPPRPKPAEAEEAARRARRQKEE